MLAVVYFSIDLYATGCYTFISQLNGVGYFAKDVISKTDPKLAGKGRQSN